MILEQDTIQFESRSEVENVLEALETYAEEHNANDDVKRLIDVLDVLQMSW